MLETLVAVCKTRHTLQSSSFSTMGSNTFFSREDLENFVFTTFSTGDIGGLDLQASHAHVVYKLQITRKNSICSLTKANTLYIYMYQSSSVQLLSCVRLFVTP